MSNVEPTKKQDKFNNGAQQEFVTEVEQKAKRKIKAKRNSSANIWMGLGMMGLVGWSIALPALLGAALGIYLDKHFKFHYSWTLALLSIGLLLGCINAWRWISKENSAISKNNEEPDE